MRTAEHCRIWVLLTFMILVTVTGQVDAQRVSLASPEAVYPEGLSSVTGIRELSDGRLMVSDRLGQAVMILNVERGIADTIGHVGGGPGEYQIAGPLFPWRGDSTLMVDAGNTRFILIGPDGGFGESFPLMSQEGEMMRFVMPEGTDLAGRVYFQSMSFGMPGAGMPEPPDEAAVARWRLDDNLVDTVVTLALPERKTQRVGGNFAMMSIPFGSQDDWAAAPDGRVAVARGAGYHVEWWNPDGTAVVGEAVPYEPVRVTKDDKDEWRERRANPAGGGIFVAMGPGGGVETHAPSRGARMVGPEIDDDDWPDVKAAFPTAAVSVTDDGTVWVRRYVAAGSSPEYDVFDSQGQRIRTVVLQQDARVAGFGKGVVYVTRSDEYDLQWLQKHKR
ncbi:MAG: hypothetical protein P8X82_03465 [Gemmatimonadales bacterium]|jgi:hypothetical protein